MAAERGPDDGRPQSISDIVGGWGPWQRDIFIFFFIGAMFSAWHGLSLSFYAPNIDFWCVEPSSQNVSREMWIEESKQNPEVRCSPHINESSISCSKWEYDHSFYEDTILSEWNLVCDRSWLSSLTQSSYMAGMMFAVIFFGHMGDKIGRFPVIICGIVIELVAGLLCAFASSIEMFLVARFLLAIGASGRWATGFVLILELSGLKYRADLGIAIQFGWAIGYIIIPLMAYFFPDFRVLQLICTVPQFLLLLGYWMLPESPRWLLTQGRVDEAEEVLRKGAKANNVHIGELDAKIKSLASKFHSDDAEKREIDKMSLWDLWRHPNMRKKTACLYFTWFTNTFVYYGLSLNTNNLGGNPFVNFLVAGAVEFPAYSLAIFLLRQYGRRSPLAGAMLVGGLSCLLTIFFIGPDYVTLKVVFAMIGKFCITSTFGMLYVYTAEIFPTIVRNVGVGSSSMVGRIGSIIAPFVKELGEFTNEGIPMAIFGILAITDAAIVFFYLPETRGREIPDTIREVVDFESDRTTDVSVSNADLTGDETVSVRV